MTTQNARKRPLIQQALFFFSVDGHTPGRNSASSFRRPPCCAVRSPFDTSCTQARLYKLHKTPAAVLFGSVFANTSARRDHSKTHILPFDNPASCPSSGPHSQIVFPAAFPASRKCFFPRVMALTENRLFRDISTRRRRSPPPLFGAPPGRQKCRIIFCRL